MKDKKPNKPDAEPIRSVWMLTREYRGLAGAGGVKDVSRELAEALARAGVEVTVLLPRYGLIRPEEAGFRHYGPEFEVDLDYDKKERREKVKFWRKDEAGVRLLLVDADRYAEKFGVYTYTESEEAADPSHKKGEGHYDYFAMNVLLQKAALDLAMCLRTPPEIFHCQDGHTAILPAKMNEVEGLRHFFHTCGALITVHNAGIGYHQEVADLPFARAITGLPWRVITSSLLNGAFDPFLAGAAYAPINTVSENYARELQETEWDTMTGWLGHALRDRGIHLDGVTNGINSDDFDPTKPKRLGLPASFDPATGNLAGKAACRQRLIGQLRAGRAGKTVAFGSLVDRPSNPLLTVISRLTEQKGIDVLAQALEGLLGEDDGFQVLILGTGTRDIELHLTTLAEKWAHASRMMVVIGYDPALATKIYAAGDFFVIPSRFEPCGLTDFMAQLMGNLPVVRLTGGLVKVQDGFNGFAYTEHTPKALAGAIRRGLQVFRQAPGTIRQMQANAVHHIRANYTWDRVRDKYLRLYRRARDVRVC